MHQELAVAKGVVVEDVPLLVRADVHADEEELAVLDRGVRIAQVDPAGAEGLHLGPGKGDAGLQRLLDVVVVVGLLVLSDEFDAGGLHGRGV